jgi:hypothetical protein
MDKFEQMTEMWQKMTPEEQRKGMEIERAKCLCPPCPTYTSCAKNAKELLFCANGKSFMASPMRNPVSVRHARSHRNMA